MKTYVSTCDLCKREHREKQSQTLSLYADEPGFQTKILENYYDLCPHCVVALLKCIESLKKDSE